MLSFYVVVVRNFHRLLRVGVSGWWYQLDHGSATYWHGGTTTSTMYQPYDHGMVVAHLIGGGSGRDLEILHKYFKAMSQL